MITGLRSLRTDLTRRKALAVGAFSAAAIVALGATAVYAYNDTTVTVSIDGESQDVRFFGRSVDTALAAADATVGDGDLVVPALGSTVTDGAHIRVVHARDLTVVTDGQAQTHRVAASTVGEAFELLGVRDGGSRLSVSRSQSLGRDGLTVNVTTPKQLIIAIDGQEKREWSTAPTVGEALTDSGLGIDGDDLIEPAVDTQPTADMRINVVRVERVEDRRTEEIPFTKDVKKTDTLLVGESKVERPGVPGERTIVDAVIRHNGQEVGREPVSNDVTRQPVSEVRLEGTKPKPAPEPNQPAPAAPAPGQPAPAKPAPPAPAVPAGSVWDRLAQCESGGNWQINTGNGFYGGLQFSARSWRAVGGSGLPHQHSRETQIEMGKRLQARQGWGAWPSCSRKLGLR